MVRSSFLVVTAAMAMIVGCGTEPPVTESESDSPPIDFTGWPTLTPEPVRLPRHLFSLCVMTPEHKRLGPHFVPSAQYFTNPEGFDAVRRGDVPVPARTTVLKKKLFLDNDGKEYYPPHYAAMIKREPGYDPDNGDWEYLYAEKYNNDRNWKVDRGKLDSCIACHRQAKATDYLFRTYLKK